MKYIKFYGGTAFCGEDFEYYEVVDDNLTDEDLDQMAADYAYDNASSYEDVERDYQIDEDNYASYDDFEAACDEARDEYYGESYGHWEEITREEFLENGGVEQ